MNLLTCVNSCSVALPRMGATNTRKVNAGRATTVDLTWPCPQWPGIYSLQLGSLQAASRFTFWDQESNQEHPGRFKLYGRRRVAHPHAWVPGSRANLRLITATA